MVLLCVVHSGVQPLNPSNPPTPPTPQPLQNSNNANSSRPTLTLTYTHRAAMAHCIGLLLPGYHGSFVKVQKHLSLDIPSISGIKMKSIIIYLSILSICRYVCPSICVPFITGTWPQHGGTTFHGRSSWDKPPQLRRTVQTRLGTPTCPP